MKRSIRHSLRWSLVVTLTTFLSSGPAVAGWLHRHIHAGPPAPVCSPAPVCCVPQPEPVCCSGPVYSPPVIDCCEPAPCCGDVIFGGTSVIENVSQSGESVVPDADASVESEPSTDTEQTKDADQSESQQDSAAELKSPSDNEPQTPAPTAAGQENAGDQSGAKQTDTNVIAPPAAAPTPQPSTTPESLPDTLPETDSDALTDDLFGGEDEPAMELPADSPPTAPVPADAAADDLFGDAADSDETPQPAAPATVPAESGPIDDLFGAPDDAPAPADAPAPRAESNSVDDLFGAGFGDDVDNAESDPAMPADDASDSPQGIDDLFGAPADAAPADSSSESIDDLFGDPSAQPDADEPTTPPAPADDADDLFGDPPAEDSEGGTLDDLFSSWIGGDSVEDQAVIDGTEMQPAAEATAQVSQSTDVVTGLENTEPRTWVDNTGDFRTDGRLIKIGDDYVKLLKENGKTCTVPMSRLSDNDSDYVRSISQQLAMFVMATPKR